MEKGTATLKSPETKATVGTFTQTCHGDGTATAKVVLTEAVQISGKTRLEVFSTIKDAVIIGVDSPDGSNKTVHEFSGKSSLGCLPNQTGVSLVRTPGGDLGSLLIVIGDGTVHDRHVPSH